MRMLTALMIVLACAPARAETFKNANGQIVGRSTTNNAGTTFYDSMGRQTGRSTTNNAGTTFYDSSGRMTGRSTGRR
jgi:hypothetical protein